MVSFTLVYFSMDFIVCVSVQNKVLSGNGETAHISLKCVLPRRKAVTRVVNN